MCVCHIFFSGNVRCYWNSRRDPNLRRRASPSSFFRTSSYFETPPVFFVCEGRGVRVTHRIWKATNIMQEIRKAQRERPRLDVSSKKTRRDFSFPTNRGET